LLIGSGLALRRQFSAAGTSLALNSDLTGNIGNVKGTNGKFPVFAHTFDQKVLQDAVAISPDYADLVSLGTRQAMAGLEITLSMLPDGSFNMSGVKAFMNDVGNSQ
jgi:hypothetical protein